MKKQCAAVVAAMTLSAVAQADEGDWSVYGGVDYVIHEISVTRTGPTPSDPPGALPAKERLDGDSNGVRLRAGLWLSEDFAVEVQTSVSSDGVDGPDTGEIESYYGLFINPRAQVYDWLDVVFPVGFTSVDASVYDPSNGGVVSTSNSGVAYGLNIQLRLGELLVDEDSLLAGLGVGAGFMVYNSSDNVNVRGYNAGVQFGLEF